MPVDSHSVATGFTSEGNKQPLLLLDPRMMSPPINRFEREQEYEGVILSVDEQAGTFLARLVDQTGSEPDEEAEFLLDDIEGDLHLAKPGSRFTWTIGLRTLVSSKQRVSDLRLRRFAAFSSKAVAKAEREAAEMSAFLRAHDSTTPIIT